MSELIFRLSKRGYRYFIVGLGTFTLDMLLLFTLINTTNLPEQVAIALGFYVGVTINFYLCYRFVYAGTKRTVHHGYFYFVAIATMGAVLITSGTTLMHQHFFDSLLLARLIVGGLVGCVGFLLNTFYNFKLI